MTEARFDIEIQDRVAKSIRTELQGIASAARTGWTNVKGLKAELSGLSSSALRGATTATNESARATNQRASASDTATRAMEREARAADALTAKYQAQARAAAAQGAFNSRLGVGGGARGAARESASVFENTAPTAAMLAAEQAASKLEQGIGKLGGTSRMSQQHLMNLGFQVNDVVVSLISGQKPLTVFVQQGAQIGQIASQAGVGIGGMAKAVWGLLLPFAPLVLAIGAAAGAFAYFNHEVNKDSGIKEYSKSLGLTAKEMKKLEGVTVTMGDTAKAVFQVIGAAIWEQIGGGAKKAQTAFNAWFDDLMERTKAEANFLIGAMVGAYRGILATWRQWPAAIGDLFVSGVNMAIRAINDLSQKAVQAVNAFIIANNAMPLSIKLPTITATNIAEMQNQNAGAAREVGASFMAEVRSAMDVDYVGQGFAAVRNQAIENAQARLRRQAQEMMDDRGAGRQGGKTDAEKRADEMNKLNNELDSQILLLGFYGQALERESKFQAINNALLAKKITLTATEEASIRSRLLLIQDGARVQDALNKIEEAAAGPQRDYQAQTEAITIALRDNVITEGEATRQRNLARTALLEGLDPLKAYNDNIRQSTEFAALYGKELAIQTRAQELFNAAVAAGAASAGEDRGAFVGTARQEAKQQEQTSFFQQIDPREETANVTAYVLDNYTSLYANIDALRQQDLISEEVASERKKNLDKAFSDARLDTMSGMFGQLASLQSSSNREMAALGKAAAIAQATIDGYRAVQAALAGPPGPPWSFAIAGVTAAMTAVNVARIAGVGFMSGGYTGNMATNQVAGAVHGQEYVFDAAATKRIGVPALEAMRNGSSLGGGPSNDNGIGGPRVVIKPMPGVYVEEVKTSSGEIELIARRVAREEAPGAVAADMASNPNGKTSKAVGRSFGLKRAL